MIISQQWQWSHKPLWKAVLKFCNGMAGMFNGVVAQNQSLDILYNKTIVTVGDILEDYDIRKVFMMISTW